MTIVSWSVGLTTPNTNKTYILKQRQYPKTSRIRQHTLRPVCSRPLFLASIPLLLYSENRWGKAEGQERLLEEGAMVWSLSWHNIDLKMTSWTRRSLSAFNWKWFTSLDPQQTHMGQLVGICVQQKGQVNWKMYHDSLAELSWIFHPNLGFQSLIIFKRKKLCPLGLIYNSKITRIRCR